ncbi:MAG: alkaline phosphatase family protein [Proteobacteria bacterium]|jgi:predicted AlkP superfamily pyrophosphatase or phosphodiesterase|nr:alkaline phosphatase family protein [Pseudomonadota bacterium]
MTRALAIVLLLSLAAACGADDAAKPPEKKAAAAKPVPPPPAPVTRPLLLVGIDGATWDLIDPLLQDGALPNLAKLLESGARAPLKTYEPTLSPLIWTTIATGVLPGVHGIRSFAAPVPGTGKTAIVSSNMRRVKALWNHLSDQGTTVGVIGWWATYPAEEVNGFVVSDQANDMRRDNYMLALDLDVSAGEKAAADPRAVWPKELGAEIGGELALPTSITREQLARFFELPEGRADLLDEKNVDDEDILSVFKFAYLIDASFLEAGVRALEKRRPTFAAIYLNGLDAAEHHFWKYMAPEKFRDVPAADVARYEDVIRNYYIYMDEALGRLLALYPLDTATVIVVSDHGHVANAAYDPKSKDHFARVCSGTHDRAPPGVIAIAGKDVVPGADLGGASVLDITPTVLALLGAPVGEEMPGRVLEQAISKEFLEGHPIRRVKALSKGWKHSDAPIPSRMNEALQEKLRGLGYIE